MAKIKKRHMLLLEVLIAIALVAICILPLIGPHVDLLRQQKKFISTMELDRAVNLLYVDLLEQLHKNALPFNALLNTQPQEIQPLIDRIKKDINLPHLAGTYQFKEIRHKGKAENGWQVYLLELTFALKKLPGENAPVHNFPYEMTIIRKVSDGEGVPADSNAADEKKKEEPPTNPDGRVTSKSHSRAQPKEVPK